MTLAVARIVGNRIAVVADTLLTEHGRPLPVTLGTIKTHFLPGDVCVAFSNSPELAGKDFDRYQQMFPLGVSFSETVSFFEKSSTDTGNDYLLAFSKFPRIVKIADGRRVQSAATTLWIGDGEGFRRFRAAEQRNARREEAGRAINATIFMDDLTGSPGSDLYAAMREVVVDRSCPTVGGFISVVSNRDPGFRHSVYSDMLFDWPSGQGEDFILDLNHQIDFGSSGENYEYAVSQFSTGYLGLNIVGFYLLKARKAFLFFGKHNGLARECTVLSDVAPTELALRLSQAIGVDFGWLLAIMAASPTRTATVNRWPLRTQGPQGVGMSIFCHANTFPQTNPSTA